MRRMHARSLACKFIGSARTCPSFGRKSYKARARQAAALLISGASAGGGGGAAVGADLIKITSI